MAERGISVDHSTVHRWAIKLLPVLEKVFRGSKRKVSRSWLYGRDLQHAQPTELSYMGVTLLEHVWNAVLD